MLTEKQRERWEILIERYRKRNVKGVEAGNLFFNRWQIEEDAQNMAWFQLQNEIRQGEI
jgi:hypothetical protein